MIIPYDSSNKKIDGVQLKTLFVTEEQRFFLDELDKKMRETV